MKVEIELVFGWLGAVLVSRLKVEVLCGVPQGEVVHCEPGGNEVILSDLQRMSHKLSLLLPRAQVEVTKVPGDVRGGRRGPRQESYLRQGGEFQRPSQ